MAFIIILMAVACTAIFVKTLFKKQASIVTRKKRIGQYIAAHFIFSLITLASIIQNEAILFHNLGIEPMHWIDRLWRSFTLPFFPLFYPGPGLVGPAITCLVYLALATAIIKINSPRLFQATFGVWCIYSFILLIVMSDGLRS